MLDTDAVSFVLRGKGQVAARMVQHRPSELCISAITLAELLYGADRVKSKSLHRKISVFTSNVAVVPFDEACAAQFGRIASELAGKGAPIGDFDVLIAAHAMVLKLTLVTNNEKHFRQVEGLDVVNWVS